MIQHDGGEWPREEAPQTDNWEDIQTDIQTEEPLDASTPEPLWQVMGELMRQLLERHPMLFWSGIWVTILLAAGIAVTGLMAPELSTRKPLTSAVREEAGAVRASASSVEDAVSPVWLVGAIALSCGVGSLLLSQRFKQPPSTSRLLDDFDLLADELPGSVLPQPSVPPLPTEARPISPLALQTPINQPGGDRRTPLGLQSQPTVPFLPGITHPNVTIMTGEQRPPLDDPHLSETAPVEAPGLEELMTIQQRRKEREIAP